VGVGETHEFRVVLRGYDRSQVDLMIQRVGAALASTDPGLRARVSDEVRAVQFAVVLRGFDRHQVDVALKRLAAELE
jgi:DivIVA domain-containing protein